MSLSNDDLAPVPTLGRTWSTWNYAALWIGMSICIPSYMLASGLIASGMSWWQAILTIGLGNLVVLVPMVLNGHAGTRYGIPFPVYARAPFGTRGANVPAVLRAIVACGWFGIQTWIGGKALFAACRAFGLLGESGWMDQDPHAILHVQKGQFFCFIAFWLVNMVIVWAGIESIRKLLVVKSFFLPAASFALLLWALRAAGGLGPMLDHPSRFKTAGDFFTVFVPSLTGMVGFWATLSLNIPDFTRFAKSQKAQVLGQAIGLPTSMSAIAFVGVAVTSATILIFGKEVWDPVDVVDRAFKEDALIVGASMFAVVLSTLATNIAANIVSPAMDFSNLAPSLLGFRGGGYITGVVGILMCPWKLVEDPSGYIFTWLIGYSALLGPIGGILIADYFLVRRMKLDVQDLYRHEGRYGYTHGVNPIAILALVLGVLPCVPGFLAQVAPKLEVAKGALGGFVGLYQYAWFVGFFIAGTVYVGLMKAVHGDLPVPDTAKAHE